MAEEKKKVLKALPKKNFDLSAFKASNKLNTGIKDKPLEWIGISSAWNKTTGLPGFPKGYVSLIRGHSNTGKTTLIMEAIVGCQRAGILPVIIDTENNWSWERARLAGVEFEDVADPATGEVLDPEGFFIYVNNDHLLENYGKVHNKAALEATVEDVASFMNDLLQKQAQGDLPYELCFCFDSIGTLDCRQGIESKGRNNMWIASSYKQSMAGALGYQIPASRHLNKQYTNTFIAVQKIWMKSNPVGQPTVMHSGGDGIFYHARLIYHLGGHAVSGIKLHTATSKGVDFMVGVECKVSIPKYQIEYTGMPLSGNAIVSTEHGFVLPKEGIDEYKKTYRKHILSKLQVNDDAEIEFGSVESTDEVVPMSEY